MRPTTDTIVWHCAATVADQEVTAADVDRWHRQRGWRKIGYHFFIRRNGMLEYGRAEHEIGAHASDRGYNKRALGVCMAGGGDINGRGEDNFLWPQWATSGVLLVDLLVRWPTIEQVIGHRQIKGVRKDCPSFEVADWLDRVAHDAERGAEWLMKRSVPVSMNPKFIADRIRGVTTRGFVT